MNRPLKIIVEKHEDGYVAYPIGVRGVVVGQGETYEEAVNDLKSAIRFHVESFGASVFGGSVLGLARGISRQAFLQALD
jgi:predicted RNase H-like HicB family nuclease